MRAHGARPKVLHVSGKHQDFRVDGIRVDAFDCPDTRVGPRAVKEVIRDSNESMLLKLGNSNVLFVRGSLLVGRRAKTSVVLRDMVSYWMREGWPVVTYLGNGRILVDGFIKQLEEYGSPPQLIAVRVV